MNYGVEMLPCPLQRLIGCAACAVVAAAQSACAVPVTRGEPDPFPEDRFEFIEIGVSTREDIANAMNQLSVETKNGEEVTEFQPLKFHDDTWWLYGAERKESKWIWLIHPYWYIPPGPISGSEDYRYLLVKFDAEGIVTDYEFSKSEGGGCNASGVCSAWGAYGLADINGITPLDEHSPASGHCRVFLYGPGWMGFPVSLDGAAQGWTISTRAYFAWEIRAGNHELASQSPDESGPVTWNFNCQPGESVFVELRPKHVGAWEPEWETRFVEVPEKKARRRLKRGQPLLIPSTIPDYARVNNR